jgi:hypothetical protein
MRDLVRRLLRWLRWQPASRRSLPAARQTIADLPDGQPGRIVGVVLAAEPLEAPLSGRRCVYFEIVVESDAGGDDPPRHHAWQRRVSFVIDDGTGRAFVDADSARMTPLADRYTASGEYDAPSVREAALLARFGEDGGPRYRHRRHRYREAVIEVGASVVMVGAGVREPDPDALGAPYRGGQPTRLRMISSVRNPLVISKPDPPEA